MPHLWHNNHINKVGVGFVFLCTFSYSYFFYLLPRESFGLLCVLWTFLFAGTYFILERTRFSFRQLIVLGVIFRILSLFALPNLSQDFYRFIWDGRMLLEGYNPYLSLPEELVANSQFLIAQAKELYAGMGTLNGSHYTNYPPVSQFCYGIAAFFAGKSILGSVLVLRLILILADVGILIIGSKLLKQMGLGQRRIFWYFLNPFVLIELTGNLHFEGLMLFFVLLSLYWLYNQRLVLAAISLAVAVSVKLIPLLFLPLFFFFFIKDKSKTIADRWIRLVSFYSSVLGTTLLLFLPFIHPAFISNFSQTIGLWFQNFEFNASIYYIIRWIGYQTIGWNIIGSVGKILPLIIIGVVLALTFLKNNGRMYYLMLTMLLSICGYYLLSTTVHPWYITIPLGLCLFTNYRFPVVWSFVIVLSYAAYQHSEFRENLWLVGLEYLVVVGFFLYELRKYGRHATSATTADQTLA